MGCSPHFSDGNTEVQRAPTTHPTPRRERVAELAGMQTRGFSGSKCLSPSAKGCFCLKSAGDPLWQNCALSETGSHRRGNGGLARGGVGKLAGDVFPPCGKRKGDSPESN